MADTTFRFKEKSQPYNYVQFLVSRMLAAGPKEAVIRNGTCLGQWFPEQVVELADFLKRDNCRIIISSKQEPDGVKYDRMEERYQIEYATVEMDHVLAKASETVPSDAFEMLPPNPFIPKDFEIKGPIPTPPSPKPPSVVMDNKSLKLWHKLDDQWGVPKGVIHVRIRNPRTDRTPKEAVKTSMVFSLFSDHVQRKFYDAILAGHSYGLSTDQDNIHIKVKGYNEKLPALLMQLVEEIKVFQPTPERFGIVMDWHERSYKNFALRRPDTLASTFMNYLLAEVSWLPSEALNQLQDVTLEEVHSHISELLKGSRTEMMLHGNFSTHEAKVLAEQFTGAVPGDGSDKRNPHRTYLLPEQGCNFVYQLPGLDAANVNSAIDFRVQVCLSTSFLERAKLQLIGQILSEPVFDQLRTKEQLGYIVHGSTNLHVGVMGYSITIQSEKSAGYLEERIEAFYDMMVERLEQMSEEEMEKNKQSLIEDLLEKDKNMYEEISNHWRRITEGYCDFEKYERDAKLTKKLTKFDILSFFKKHFLRSSTSRRKLSVQILSQTVHDDDPIMSTLQSQLPHPALEEIEKFVKTRPPIIKVEEKVIQVFDEHGIPVEGRQGFTNSEMPR
ncbi:LuxS/MPP-like metallohydrolase [Atractiella rhizophila]|nr:LuxS/MPP-like metallohydrolase [Atractiella rhizophila]